MKKLFILILFLVQFKIMHAQISSGDITNTSGYHLEVTESSSTIESDADFVYTVNFVFPVTQGETGSNFNIVLNYDPRLDIILLDHPLSYTPVSGGSSFTPVFGYLAQGQLQMTIASTEATTPGTVFGQFTLKTRMRPHNACANDTLRSFAVLNYFHGTPSISGSLTTNTPNTIVQSIVQITNPWTITKGCNNAPINGLGNCSHYLLTGNVMRYRVDIQLHDPNHTRGSQDLNVNTILDQPSIAGVFTMIPNSALHQGDVPNYPSGISITNSGQINVPSGLLDATNLQHYTINFTLTIPLATPLGCVENVATIHATTPCGDSAILPSLISRVERVDTIPESLVITKWADMHGNLPGCTGTYVITIRNAVGNGSLNYDLWDIMPDCILTSSIGATTPVSGLNIAKPSQFRYHMWGTVPAPTGNVPETYTYRIDFTIGPACQGIVTNEIWTTPDPVIPPGPGDFVTSYPIIVLRDTTLPCLEKSICGVPGDTAGQTIRFRLRVQNFGRRPLLNWHIKDNLHSIGLEYAGGESYYWTDTRPFVDTVCGAPPNSHDWAGMVTPHWNQLTGIITYDINTMSPQCDTNSLYEGYLNIGCNKGGTRLPSFYIEFNATIMDTAAIGVAQNCANLTNDSTWNVISCVPFNVRGLTTYSMDKAVSLNGGESFEQSATVHPGQAIQYRLHASSSGAPVRTPFFIDLLPKNRGHIAPLPSTLINDRYLTQPADRGSTLNVNYISLASSIPVFTSFTWTNSLDLNLQNDFGASANFGVNNANWGTTAPPALKNIRIDYSSLSSAQDLTYIFNARIDSFGSGHACNTFGFDAYKKVMQNFVPVLQLQLPLESSPVCVDIPKDSTPCCYNDSVIIPHKVCSNTAALFCAFDTCGHISYHWNFGDSSSSTGKCITHSYVNPGNYTVTVTWQVCDSSFTRSDTVVVQNCNPACCCRLDSFIIPKQVCTGFAAQFCVADHCDRPISYTWDFGDNTSPVTTTGKCISHTYAQIGVDSLRVTWTDCAGEQTKVLYIEAMECRPCDIDPVISIDSVETTCPLVYFHATPVQNNLMYVWDFGDGSFGTGQAPTHYYGPGSYMVTLFIYSIDPNDGGLCKCKVKTDLEVHVPNCGQGFPNKGSLLVKGKMASSIPINRDNGNEILTATPNPFSHTLSVQFKTNNLAKAAYTLSLLNANGSSIMSKSIVPNTTIALNTENYAAGTYLLTLRSRDGTVSTMRVVKINH